MKKTTFQTSSSVMHSISHEPIARKKQTKLRKKHKSYKKRLLSIVGGILIIGVISVLLIFGIFLRGLPDISGIKDGKYFVENTKIFANDGTEIYSFNNEGKRIYVHYDDISPSIIDALIATEDKRFFENPGFDLFGMARAGFNYIFGRTDRIQATSTISQQLVRNTLLSNERSIKRKIREMYLSYQLNLKYSKEDILEMYLNVISYGHNASGVEQASRTFFGKSAKEVGPLGASILASLPKSPTRYSPYSHRSALMGKIEAYPINTPANEPKDRILLTNENANKDYTPLYTDFKDYIKQLAYTKKGDFVEICNIQKAHTISQEFYPDSFGCKTIPFDRLITFLGNIRVSGNVKLESEAEELYAIEYTPGRKDIVAQLMFEGEKIDGNIFGSIIFNGLEFQFQKIQDNIKYPYFVMYIKEYLEEKYGKNNINIQQGLRIYTTIDPKLQDFAEKAVKEQVEENKKKGQNATSAALVSMNNTDGRLLAMVGGPDYFDEENGGNNNMITSHRQPGSSFKPIVYALAIAKNPIGTESPVADVATKFGKYEPKNYDGGYKGVMSLAKALAYSRNIPAVKMYFLAGQEKEILEFSQKIGLKFFNASGNIATPKDGDYGASLALGSGEIRPIDMMQAYSVFANLGKKQQMYAITRIEDTQGGLIEEFKIKPPEEIFSPAASYIVNKILSTNSNRPESPYWRNQLTVPGKTVAAKTGTANKPAKKGSRTILPGDTWTIGYSPDITTITWAGNVDGSPMKGGCDGINCAAPLWNKFMREALKDIKNRDWEKPKELFTFTTSKFSGLLATEETPKDNIVTNIMAKELKEYDKGNEEKLIDELCGGPVTDATPPGSIIKTFTPTAKPIIDRFDPEWTAGFFKALNITITETIGKQSTTPCERPGTAGDVSISTQFTGNNNNILKIQWNGNRMIQKLSVLQNGDTVNTFNYGSGASTIGSQNILFGQKKHQPFTLELIDIYGYVYMRESGDTSTENPTIESTEVTSTAPKITLINPSRGSINLYEGGIFNLRFSVEIATEKRNIDVILNGSVVQSANSGNVFMVPVSSVGLSPGEYPVKIIAKDENNQSTTRIFKLNILQR